MSKTIYIKKFSRKSFCNDLLKWPIKAFLLKLSKSHILIYKRRQLVVFSYDQIAHSINIDGLYEKNELDTFFEWLMTLGLKTNQSVALDIGANIGNHSLYFSDFFKEVYSFEPNLRTFKVLSINAELASNIKCFNYGLSDKTYNASLSVNPYNIGESSVSDMPSIGINTIELKTFDSTFPDIGNIQLVKVDVEGHELQVLIGAEAAIRRNMPIILFEQHESDFQDGKSAVILKLNEYGYKKFAILRKYPRINGGFLKKLLIVPLLRLMFGEASRIELVNQIEPGFYSFVIALPEWVPLNE